MDNDATADYGTLYDYATGKPIRPATEAERDESDAAATIDGGVGAFDCNGVTCYVK